MINTLVEDPYGYNGWWFYSASQVQCPNCGMLVETETRQLAVFLDMIRGHDCPW